MLQTQYIDYIRKQLLELAVKKYPQDTHRQMLYQIGFMQALLAEFMNKDNVYAHKFAERVEAVNDQMEPL